MPVVKRSTVTTILGRDSFLKRLILRGVFFLIAARYASRNLHNSIIVNAALSIDFFQNLYDEVSVVVINSIDEGFYPGRLD